MDTTFGILTGDVSGILGFAFQGLAATKAVPFWQALINTNQLTSPEFSFYLGRAPSGNDVPDIDGGVFTLGGTNETLFSGDVEFVDMPPTERNWVLSLTGKLLYLCARRNVIDQLIMNHQNTCRSDRERSEHCYLHRKSRIGIN